MVRASPLFCVQVHKFMCTNVSFQSMGFYDTNVERKVSDMITHIHKSVLTPARQIYKERDRILFLVCFRNKRRSKEWQMRYTKRSVGLVPGQWIQNKPTTSVLAAANRNPHMTQVVSASCMAKIEI